MDDPYADEQAKRADERERLNLVREFAQEMKVPISVEDSFGRPPVSMEGALNGCIVMMRIREGMFKYEWIPIGLFSTFTQARDHVESLPLSKKRILFTFYHAYSGRITGGRGTVYFRDADGFLQYVK